MDHVTLSTNHVTQPADHVIQSDATADSMSADSLDCTLSPTVTTAPGTATATNDIESSEQPDEEKADELDTGEETVSEPVCGNVASAPGGGSGVEDIASCTNHTRTFFSRTHIFSLLYTDLFTHTHTHSLSLSPALSLSLSLSLLSISLSSLSLSPSPSLPLSLTADTAKEGIDFPYFHRLHDDVATDFSQRCSDWREKSDSVQSS